MSWRPPVHDAPGIERNWYEACFRAHAGSCGCGNFIAHINLLAGRYGFTGGPPPPGGPPPGTPQVRASRNSPAAPQQPPALPWHGDGGEGGAAGPPGAGGDAAADAHLGDEELADLLDAIEDDAQCSNRRSKTRARRTDGPPTPIDTLEEYKWRTRNKWDPAGCSTPLTGEGAILARELSNACTRNLSTMKAILHNQKDLESFLQQRQQRESSESPKKAHIQRKKGRKPLQKSRRRRRQYSSSSDDSESSGSSSSSSNSSPEKCSKRKRVST
uniref:Probable protein VP2 n=1 Tax=Torque teno virus (isolate Human/Japan/SANBAN/1999) TaxID=486277 RepID=ORF23_TTVV5|nr:RecName: Full=Probable protein VP2; AltName: Full=ORF2/3 protein [Torque teno virus Human/Japan/SANBAN/1999]